MKAPVGLLSDRTVLRQQDGGDSPRQVRVCKYRNPLRPLRVQIPPFVTCGDIFPPERGKSFLKGRASGETGHFAVKPKSLPQCRTFAESGTANAVYLYAPSSENAMPELPRTLRHCSLKNYSSAEYGRSKA